MRVYISKPIKQPRFKISDDVKLSDSYRMSINEWCCDFFGFDTKEIMEHGDVMSYNNGLIMNQQTYDAFMKEMDNMK